MKCEILCQTKKNGLKYLIHKGLTYLKVFLTKRRHWSSSALVFFSGFAHRGKDCDLGKRKKKNSNNKNVFPLGEDNLQ